jgi:hypothetical protein
VGQLEVFNSVMQALELDDSRWQRPLQKGSKDNGAGFRSLSLPLATNRGAGGCGDRLSTLKGVNTQAPQSIDACLRC